MRPNEKTNSKVEILIAEDSPTQAARLGHLLEQHGYGVTTATNGREALALLDRCRPTLIISDVMMPELDGYGLCKAIKANEEWKDIPVMLVTTLSDALDVVRGLECGADNFIRKPYDEKYLLSRVDYLLMNLKLRKNQKMQMGLEIDLGGQRHFITSERQQILDLLISTYEQAININDELKVREKELAHSNEVLSGLYRVAAGLNQAGSEREVAEVALERAMELPGIQAGWIVLREGETGFRLAAARNLPPALEAPGEMEGDCACRRRLLSGELDSVTNILECERLHNATGDTRGLQYHASVPLWLGDRTLGVMNLVGPEKGLFNEDELNVLYGVGNQLAVALERARLRDHLEKLVEERTARVIRLNRVYAVLSGINTTIVRVRDRQQLFEEACRIAIEQGKFTFAWIGTFDAGTQEITPVARAGRDDGYLSQIHLTGREDAPGNCELTATAITLGVPVVCNDIASDERMKTWRAEALKRGYRSAALFPLVMDGQPIGLFVLYAPDPNVFDEEEMALLVEMAGDISFALDHLRQEEQLEQRTIALTAEIVERKRIEQQQARLLAILEATPDLVGMSDLDGNVRYINQAGLRMLGYEPGHDVSAMHIHEAYPELAAKQVLETGIPHAIEHGSWTGETAFLRTDGREVPISQVILAHRGPSGSVEYLSTIARDMTARNEAKDELRRQVRRQSAIAELGRMAMTSAGLQVLFDEACRLVAKTLDTAIAAVLEELPPGGDEVVVRAAVGWPEVVGMIFPARQGSQAGYTLLCDSSVVVSDYSAETRFRPPDLLLEHKIVSGVSTVIPGKERPFGVIGSLTKEPRSFSDNDVLFIRAIANILGKTVESRQMEEALRRSEERYRQIVDGAQEGIWMVDADNRVTFANPKMCDMLNYTTEEIVGRSLFDFLDPASTREVESGMARRRYGLSDDYDVQFRRRDGVSVWTRVTVSPLRDASGNYAGSLAMITDISERHAAEERIRASEQRFRALVENSSDGIVLLDQDRKVFYASPAVTRILGYGVDDVIGGTVIELVHRDDLDLVNARFAAALATESVAVLTEVRYRHKDGSWRNLETVGTNRLNEPAIHAVVINYRDISERKQMEAQLRQSQKIEAIGQLAGGIAHDFNNILSVIMIFGELAQRQLEPAHPVRARIDRMMKAAEQAAGLTRQLLAFSRKQVIQLRLLDLSEIIASTNKMLGRLLGEDIDIAVRPSPGLGTVKADPGQIEQIVMNLAVNARDAMPKGGSLTLETANVDLGEEYAATHPYMKPGRYVLLAVSDTGIGMDAETQARIFEPFFTTKPEGKGTGLGLSTVYGIVKQSGGGIEVYSEPGRGTTFKVYLPRVDKAAEAARPAVPQSIALRGHETILLVEDNETLREVIRETLEGSGYTVLPASNGEEGLAVVRECKGPIDLLLTDVVMPKLGGADLAKLLSGLRPGIRVLFMSGYTDGAITQHGVLMEGAVLLQKPFTVDKIALAVREALARPIENIERP